jgi:hypothetical protein
MGYYQGDYYQGDYYQGDPFIGGLIAGGVSWLAKKIGKKAAAPLFQGTKALARRGASAPPGVMSAFLPTAAAGAAGVMAARSPQFQIPVPGGGVFRPSRILPGGVPAYTPGECPKGFHMNKSRGSDGAPPGTKCVRNRRMNPANPQALRRSLRRVSGFAKLAQRTKRDIARANSAVGNKTSSRRAAPSSRGVSCVKCG